jgi:predicted SprT family Zn-dependent metalloprotease
MAGQDGPKRVPRSRQVYSEKALRVRQLAQELLLRHGLADWTFAFNRRKRSLGFCRYATRTIELSIYLVEHNGADEILDTLLHEIAHALVGPGHGHGPAWKRKCREIGARPVRCGQADMPAGRWRARCEGCGKRFHRYRKPKRMKGWFCLGCGPERGRLAWRLGDQPE